MHPLRKRLLCIGLPLYFVLALVGGVAVGDTVTCSKSAIEYCSGCGRLLKNYQVTIVGVRGVLDGNTIYWITRNCCGKKTSMSELEILG